MNNDKVVVNNNSGIGCFGFIQGILIIAKILNLVDWSWWIVLIPTWICLGIVIMSLAILAVAAIIAWMDK